MFPEHISPLDSVTEWKNAHVRPTLHICVFMCQPFQILKQLGVIYEILYERYGMRDSTTSYCLITTIISNVVDA